MNTKEKIEVMQAAENGEIIQCRYINVDDDWDDQDSASLAFNDFGNVQYRVKPEEEKPITLEYRVKAEYPDFDVVMLEPDISSILSLPNGQYHVIAQSMKGFYEYVYLDPDVNIFYTSREATDTFSDETIHPIAVLFYRLKS